MNFNDFGGSRDAKIDEKSMKNLIKFEAQDEVPLGINFGWILVDFGSQAGPQNRPKTASEIDPKMIQKSISKNVRCGGGQRAPEGAREPPERPSGAPGRVRPGLAWNGKSEKGTNVSQGFGNKSATKIDQKSTPKSTKNRPKIDPC